MHRDGDGGDGDVSGPEDVCQRKGEQDVLMGWVGQGVEGKKSIGSAPVSL